MLDLIDSILIMKLDLYRQFDAQDPNTGAIIKSWSFYKTIDCHAKGIISNSSSSSTNDRQVFGNKYSNQQMIQIRTAEKISYREKITNIRDAKNKAIWSEINFPSDTPTVFEVVGSTPITDPFGNVVGFNTTLSRSENQQIGI
jgi:hypothetical protein